MKEHYHFPEQMDASNLSLQICLLPFFSLLSAARTDLFHLHQPASLPPGFWVGLGNEDPGRKQEGKWKEGGRLREGDEWAGGSPGSLPAGLPCPLREVITSRKLDSSARLSWILLISPPSGPPSSGWQQPTDAVFPVGPTCTYINSPFLNLLWKVSHVWFFATS